MTSVFGDWSFLADQHIVDDYIDQRISEMQMFRLFFFAALLLVAGCASQIMEGYVGKSVTEPMLDYGRPTNVFDLGDGRLAFQWRIQSSGYIPITTPSNSTIYGTGGWATVTTQTTNYVPYSSNCLYTLYAKKRGEEWVVVAFRKPRFACE